MKRALGAALLFLFWIPGLEADEVKHILPREYFKTLIREIDQAKESIAIYLYQFTINAENSNSLPLKIAEALIQAKKRGVYVEVVLDQNIDFTTYPSQESWILEGKNWTAYEFLSANGIPVYFDSPYTYIHSKVAVIDKETVLVGSSNWSQISLTRNVETNVLIRSPEVAKNILEYLSTVERQKPQEEGPTVLVPLSFMEDKGLLAAMVGRHDTGGFDLYTGLLKIAMEKGANEFDVNEEELSDLLGLEGKPGIGYQRGLSKAYKRLKKKYNLIDYEIDYGKGVHVRLLNWPPPDKTISIPLNYWKLGWNKKLDLPGKVFYFLSLHYAALSDKKPQWSLSEIKIAENFHVSYGFINMGVTELRRANLLEALHDSIPKEGGPRRANIYMTHALYDPLILEQGLLALEKKYGADLLKRAKRCAELVYEDSNIDLLEKFILLEQKYGREKMDFVYDKLKLKNPDNPKRSAGYFISTVKSL